MGRGSLETRLRVLGFRLGLSGPSSCVEPIRLAYERFVHETASEPDGWVRWSAETQRVETDQRVFPAVPGLSPLVQLYPRFLDRLHAGLGDHALVHAGVVARPEIGAILIAAPAGHGKTTLTLELARRGWTLLSDDYAPVQMASGVVSAFPRRVGLIPDSPALASEFAAAALASSVELFGKRLVDPSLIVATAAPDAPALPIRHLFLLRGADAAQLTIEVSCAPEQAQRLAQQISSIEGVLRVQRSRGSELERFLIEPDRACRTSEALSALCSDPAVLFSVKHWSDRPSFSGVPAGRPILRREAAQLLARELLNRQPGGALSVRYSNDPARIVIDLAAALRNTSCWSLAPGALQETADAVEDLVFSAASERTPS